MADPKNWLWATCLLLVLIPRPARSSHLRAIEIRVERPDCASLQVRIVVIAFVNTRQTSVLFGGEGDFLDFGDGIRHPVPERQSVVFDAENDIGRVEYVTTHTYQQPGTYTISYTEGMRNAGILNIASSAATTRSQRGFTHP